MEERNTNTYPTSPSPMQTTPMSAKKDRRHIYKSIFKIIFVVVLAAIAFWAGWVAQQELNGMEDEILNDVPKAVEDMDDTSEAEDQLPGSNENVDDTLEDENYLTSTLIGLKSNFEWTDESQEELTDLNLSFYTCSEIEDAMTVDQINSATYKITLTDLELFDGALANIESIIASNGWVLCDDFSTDTVTEEIYYMDGRYMYLSHEANIDGVNELSVELTY